MKRLFLSAATIMAIIGGQAQNSTDSSAFKSRKLKIEEINLVSSYYSQNGNNAAVTGGIGSQKLTDIATTIDVKLTKYDRKLRKHSLDAEIGIDHYTSASSDRIDLKANSSASHADTRIYPSVSWSMENEKKGSTIGVAVSSSTEYDYQSLGVNVSYSKKTKDKNGEFSAKLQAYLDQVKIILPTELRTNGGGGDDDDDYSTKGRNSYSASFSWSQVINQRLQVSLITDFVHQTGYLSMPFYRVYFNDGTVKQEKLPDSRTKFPIGLRANYFMGDKIILRTYYRYYTDNWGLTSHTASLETPIKINPFISVSPFYRFYSQSAITYFSPYGQHTLQNAYYSSNFDLSKFHSHFFGAGIKFNPANGVFGQPHFNMIELRYGHYAKNIDMNANSISVNLRFK